MFKFINFSTWFGVWLFLLAWFALSTSSWNFVFPRFLSFLVYDIFWNILFSSSSSASCSYFLCELIMLASFNYISQLLILSLKHIGASVFHCFVAEVALYSYTSFYDWSQGPQFIDSSCLCSVSTFSLSSNN